MKKKAISIIIAAIIIIGVGGGVAYAKDHHKDNSNTVLSSNHKTKEVENSNIYLLNPDATNLEGVSPSTVTVLHNNKIVNKKELKNVTNMKYLKSMDSYLYTSIVKNDNKQVMDISLLNKDGSIKHLLTLPTTSQFSAIGGDYVCYSGNNQLTSINLKTNAIHTIKTPVQSLIEGGLINSSGDIIYEVITNNTITNYIYDNTNKKTITLNSYSDTANVMSRAYPLKSGFIIANGNTLEYFDNATGKVTKDTKGLKPKNLKSPGPVSTNNGIYSILYATDNSITYSYTKNADYSIITKEKDKEPKILADNIYLENTLTSSSPYYLYTTKNNETKLLNLKTNDIKTVSNYFLSSGPLKMQSTENYIYAQKSLNLPNHIKPTQKSLEKSILNSSLNSAQSAFDLVKINVHTGKPTSVAQNIVAFAINGNNVTTVKEVSSYTNRYLKTPFAYNIFFNGKEIIKDAISINSCDGYILYKDNNGIMYSLFDGVTTKLSINPSNYATVANNNFESWNPYAYSNYLSGYWEFTNKKGEKILCSKTENILTLVNSNPKNGYEITNISVNSFTKPYSLTLGITKHSTKEKLLLDTVNFNEIKVGSTTLHRISALDYSTAYANAMKIKTPIGSKKVSINNKTFYHSDSNLGNIYTTEDGFTFVVNSPNHPI